MIESVYPVIQKIQIGKCSLKPPSGSGNTDIIPHKPLKTGLTMKICLDAFIEIMGGGNNGNRVLSHIYIGLTACLVNCRKTCRKINIPDSHSIQVNMTLTATFGFHVDSPGNPVPGCQIS